MSNNTFNVKQSDDIGYSLTWCIETKKYEDEGYSYFWSGKHNKDNDPERYRERIRAGKRKSYANPHILGSC